MRRVVTAIFVAAVGVIVLVIGGTGLALALENQDPFCASCHTQPETTYVQRASQSRPTDLASYHTQKATRCIECHSGSGMWGRVDGLKQGAHDLSSYIRGNYHSPAITTQPLGDEACLKCHVKIYARPAGAGKAGTNHYHFYLPQWRLADSDAPQCIACHPPHTTGLEGLKFMPQGKVGKLCEDCHDALSGVVK